MLNLYDSFIMFISLVTKKIKRLNEWKDNIENRGMRVNMNKTKVMISAEWQKVMQVSVVELLIIIQYSVLFVRSGYTGNIVV